MQFIYYALQQLHLNVSICGVLADRNCRALHFAQQKNIEFKIVDYTQQQPQAFREAITYFQPDIVITTFHKIIDAATLQQFSNIKFINPHYSILPAFKGSIGMKTVEKARELNCGFVGASAHHVIAESDAGKIISQAVLPINNWNEVDMKLLKDTIFKSTCLVLLNAIIMQLDITLLSSIKTKTYSFNSHEVIVSPDKLHQLANYYDWQTEFGKIKL
jgi:phosphoribosylglycinamide formyltransferase-1